MMNLAATKQKNVKFRASSAHKLEQEIKCENESENLPGSSIDPAQKSSDSFNAN